MPALVGHEPITDEALVLKTWDFGEADRLSTLLTPHHGLIKVLVKGAKKPKSKLAAATAVLTQARLSWVPPKSHALGWGKLTQVSSQQGFEALRQEGTLLSVAQTAIGWLLLMEGANPDDYEALYHGLLEILNRLNAVAQSYLEKPTPQTLDSACWQGLLLLLNYGWGHWQRWGQVPSLTGCVRSGEVMCNNKAVQAFSVHEGGLVTVGERSGTVPVSSKTLLWLEAALTTSNAKSTHPDWDTGLRALRFMRYYSEQLAERPLKAADWLLESLNWVANQSVTDTGLQAPVTVN